MKATQIVESLVGAFEPLETVTVPATTTGNAPKLVMQLTRPALIRLQRPDNGLFSVLLFSSIDGVNWELASQTKDSTSTSFGCFLPFLALSQEDDGNSKPAFQLYILKTPTAPVINV